MTAATVSANRSTNSCYPFPSSEWTYCAHFRVWFAVLSSGMHSGNLPYYLTTRTPFRSDVVAANANESIPTGSVSPYLWRMRHVLAPLSPGSVLDTVWFPLHWLHSCWWHPICVCMCACAKWTYFEVISLDFSLTLYLVLVHIWISIVQVDTYHQLFLLSQTLFAQKYHSRFEYEAHCMQFQPFLNFAQEVRYIQPFNAAIIQQITCINQISQFMVESSNIDVVVWLKFIGKNALTWT